MRFRRTMIATLGVIAVAAAAYVGTAMYIDGVEHPEHTVLLREGDIELRTYPDMIVAEVDVSGGRSEAASRAFSPLANYIFAKERSGDAIAMTAPVTQERREKIAMTAPVTQTRASDSADWTVRFVMPSKFSLNDLPKPENKDIRLKKLPGQKRATIRFSGVPTDALIAENEQRLRDWLRSKGLEAAGAATYAYYNSPFTPGFLRRNEVMLAVREG